LNSSSKEEGVERGGVQKRRRRRRRESWHLTATPGSLLPGTLYLPYYKSSTHLLLRKLNITSRYIFQQILSFTLISSQAFGPLLSTPILCLFGTYADFFL
jgi:hypothetical protein